MLRSPLPDGAYALAFAAPILGAANFAVHALAGRGLSAAEYGLFAALLSGVLALLVPLGALQVTLARLLIEDALNPVRAFLHSGYAALAMLAAAAAAGPIVAAAVHAEAAAPVLLMGGYASAAILGVVPRAILLAEERLALLAAFTLLPGVVRLALTFAVLRYGGGLVALLVVSLIGEVFTLATLLVLTGSDLKSKGHPSVAWRSHLAPVFALAGLWALLAVDVFVARVFQTGAQAASYAATAIIAKSIVFLPHGVIQAAFPRLIDPLLSAPAKRAAQVRVLLISLLGFGALAGGGRIAARVLYGGRYVPTSGTLLILAAASAGIALANLSVHDRIAQGKPAATRCWVVVGLAGLSGLVVGGSGTALAIAMAICALLLVTLVRTTSEGAPRPTPIRLPPQHLEVSVVVPMFNCGPAVATTHVHALVDVLRSTGATFEVIVVDDGSTDGSGEAVRRLGRANVEVVRRQHAGKGAAVRAGMERAKGELIGFIDADGDISARYVVDLLSAVRSAPDLDGALASKRLETVSPHRRALSRTFRLFAALVLDIKVPDTQTGLKIFRRHAIEAVLPWCVERGFAFDAEFLAIAFRRGYSRYAYVPVSLNRFGSTTIRLRDALAAVRDTLRIGSRVGQLPITRSARTRESETTPRLLALSWKCIRHPHAGGAEVFTHEVLRRLGHKGFDVTLFASEVPGRPTHEAEDGYRIVRAGGRLTVYRKAREMWQESHDQWDVVIDQCNVRPFGAVRWVDDKPVVLLAHQPTRDVWRHELPFPLSAIGFHFLEPRWLRRYRDIATLTLSPSSAQSFTRLGLCDLHIVGVGRSLPARLPQIEKARSPTISFVGRLTPSKRPAHAIEAFRMVRDVFPDAQLHVIGSGRLEPRLRKSAPPGVTFHGRVDDTTKFDLLAHSHVLMAPSVREGWGLVVDEAAAVGTVPIGYRVPGLVDSIPAARGILVDPNPRAMSIEVIRVLPELMRTPATRGWAGGAVDWDEVAEAVRRHVVKALHRIPPTEVSSSAETES